MFSNKLFRAFGLNNNQKLKVVETFDRTKNLREVKLVYATLAESFKRPSSKRLSESKGSSSKPTRSTNRKQVLSEGAELKKIQKISKHTLRRLIVSKLNSIESLMDGYNPQRQLLEQTRQLVKKWEPTGLLEGMEDETKRHGMAVLLENQAGQLIQEASVTGGQNAEEWSGVALPLVRRIFGELAAQDFVSVQPMNLPSGLIFYLDFKYGTDQT